MSTDTSPLLSALFSHHLVQYFSIFQCHIFSFFLFHTYSLLQFHISSLIQCHIVFIHCNAFQLYAYSTTGEFLTLASSQHEGQELTQNDSDHHARAHCCSTSSGYSDIINTRSPQDGWIMKSWKTPNIVMMRFPRKMSFLSILSESTVCLEGRFIVALALHIHNQETLPNDTKI